MQADTIKNNSETMRLELPMLPMRDIVVFPHMTAPFFIGRSLSISSLEKALEGDRQIFVVAQEDPLIEEPESKDLYKVGTIGKVLQIMRLHNGTIKALFEANKRGLLIDAHMEAPYFSATIEVMAEEVSNDPELFALSKNVRNEFKRYLKEVKKRENTEKFSIDSEEPHLVADRIAPLLNMDLKKKQELLENNNPKKRLEIIYGQMLEEKEFKKVERKLKERVQGQIGRTQKEYYLNEQVKAIQKELGQGEDGKAEIEEYAEKIKEIKLSDEAKKMAEKELQKLKMMPSMSSEANVVRNYIDWILSMPWSEKTKDNFDLKKADKVLAHRHYGLEKVKERIIEFLAVAKQVGKMKGPIICLVGPPGVGKTSLARSVAEALGRKFAHVSLGGVRDEAEVRGHRRTYIGAMPGKVIQCLRKARFKNPLLLFDEIDKMTYGVMGDPAAALLEVLDPEQNHTFMDHYLEVEFDISDVLFLCTANVQQNIPPALKDRMEVINLSGYTELEKEHIAQKHLIPKQIDENGLNLKKIQFQKNAVTKIIRSYTREAGVRNLEREIAKTCRKVATNLIKKDSIKKIIVTPKRLQQFLGVPKYKHTIAEEQNEVGSTCGLAWTEAGGDMLVTEVNIMKGNGKLELTGRLGDVMKESAQAAVSFVRTNANQLGIFSSVFEKTDIHIHVPAGAIPKDGPSAGITITNSLVSAFNSIPVRKDVAMTGEITLRGKVLPIGGLKEKLLAAKRGFIKTVLIPYNNKKNLSEIPEEIINDLNIIPVKTIKEVLEIALINLPTAVLDGDDKTEEKTEKHKEVPILPQSESTESPRTYDA